MALISKNLKKTTTLQDDAVLVTIDRNDKQLNAGNKLITYENLKNQISDDIDTIIGDLTITGNLIVEGNSTLGDTVTDAVIVNGVISGTDLTFEGTANSFEATIRVADPTLDTVYTVPAVGAAAGTFIMSPGNGQTVTGTTNFDDATITNTFTSSVSEQVLNTGVTIDGVLLKDGNVLTDLGAVGTPAVQIGSVDTGFYQVSSTQTGMSQGGVLVAIMDDDGLAANTFRLRVPYVTPGAGTVTVVEYGDGRDITTELTLTDFVVGALAGAAADLGIGNIVASFPAGQHFELVSAFNEISLTCAGTAVNTDTGLGSAIASGVINNLSGTATFEDRFTGLTLTTDPLGGHLFLI